MHRWLTAFYVDCPGDTTTWEFTASAENRRWQTPPQGAPGFKPSYGTYSELIGYADIQYNCSLTMAVVVVNAASKYSEPILYSFNGGYVNHELCKYLYDSRPKKGYISLSRFFADYGVCNRDPSTSNTFQVDSDFTSTLSIKIISGSGKSLVLDPINFIWQNAPLSRAQSSFRNGQKGAIAELYGWPWVDVGKECEFLGKAGYMGVKVWPPNEHVWSSDKVSRLPIRSSKLSS